MHGKTAFIGFRRVLLGRWWKRLEDGWLVGRDGGTDLDLCIEVGTGLVVGKHRDSETSRSVNNAYLGRVEYVGGKYDDHQLTSFSIVQVP